MNPRSSRTAAQQGLPSPAPELDAKDLPAAAERFPQGRDHGSAGHAARTESSRTSRRAHRAPGNAKGYTECLETFAKQHRERLEELLRAHGPESRPASHHRYAPTGQPETLAALERVEANPLGLRSE
ncbi:hypothetical protein GCM10017562_01950 [Streptomyces roseofulvus]